MRVALAFALALSLSACTNWDGSFFDDGNAREAQPADVQAPPPAPMAESAAPAPAPMAETAAPAPARMAEAAPAPVNTAPRPASDHCIKLAKARASDAAYQGEDGDTQRSVYDRTYAECMDWDAKHAL
jgi:hypothetical protein